MLFLKSGNLQKLNIETWIVPVCEDGNIHESETIAGMVENALQLREFNGKKDEEVVFYNPEGTNARRVIFLGVGKREKLTPETFRSFAGKAVKKCITWKIAEALFISPGKQKTPLELTRLIEAMMEGACLGNHLFDKYKNDRENIPLKKIHFFTDEKPGAKFSGMIQRAETICRGTLLAREWVSIPSNDKRPDIFAKIIQAEASGEDLTVTIMDEKQLKKEKFGGILAVCAGSTSKPRMVVLEYRSPKAKKTISLVGKGVTFDSGGINLKATGFIEDMKMDMAGAAAVAATMITVARLKPAVNVVGVMPLVENMPSGDASRPGDIITTYSGKTVEIGNTDAEGRLILIDALAWAIKTHKPDAVIDVATLTGACAVALGEKIAGIFSFDDNLAGAIVESGEKTHERCWRMPLPEDYKELIKSDFADIHNMSSSKYGGAITAALFLSEFVGEARWAHIDIAGPAYVKKPVAYCNAGGTGFGVRLFCDLLDTIG